MLTLAHSESYPIMNNESKSLPTCNRVRVGEHAVARGSCLSPNPAPAEVVVGEIAPKIVLATLSLAPVPGFLNENGGTVHIGDVVAVSEGGELSISSKSILT